MPALRRLHHEDQRWQLQPHELHRVRLPVLLAVHAGDHRRALPQVPVQEISDVHSLRYESRALSQVSVRYLRYQCCWLFNVVGHRPALPKISMALAVLVSAGLRWMSSMSSIKEKLLLLLLPEPVNINR